VKWNGTEAIAEFSIDGNAFVIRKELNGFALLAGNESGQGLARVELKSKFQGGAKFLSALGDFLGASGTEVPEPKVFDQTPMANCTRIVALCKFIEFSRL
jgi:hypothetical protein